MHNYFFIRTDGKYIKINFQEIIYVEGSKNYTKIITDQRSYLVLITMKRMEEILPASLFQRIHKSFIVSLDRIMEFNTDTVYLKGSELPIGHLYKGVIEKAVIIANDNFCKVVRVAMRKSNESEFSRAV
jgi:DNA-binding LytR/AlgR family response regulator